MFKPLRGYLVINIYHFLQANIMIINPSWIRIHSYQGEEIFVLCIIHMQIFWKAVWNASCHLSVSFLQGRRRHQCLWILRRASIFLAPRIFSLLFAGWKVHMIGVTLGRPSIPNAVAQYLSSFQRTLLFLWRHSS